ncbi:MAG: porin family protein [Dokdonella sp.]
MKNTILAIALATAGLAALPVTSHAADNSGFFINGNVGQTNLSKGIYDDDDTGYSINGGYRWAVAPNLLLGVEGGYADLGEFAAKDSFRGNGLLGKAEVKGWNLGVNGHYNVTNNWYVSGRAGLFRADVKGSYLNGDTARFVDDHSNSYYAGAGIGYDFSNNFSVGLNYDYYKTDKQNLKLDPNLVSVSAEYRF